MADDLLILARKPDREINLIQGGLLIARDEYPGLDVPEAYRRFIELTEKSRVYTAGLDLRSAAAVERLNEYFFGYCRFQGNRDDYYDPRNSYLNDVMDRKLGIPITLSVLYSEIGRRLGMASHGIGFPGRFLVGFAGQAGLYVDCFDGRILDRDGCRRLLDGMNGGKATLHPDHLRESAPRETLARMVANLRNVFVQRKNVTRALRFAELAVSLQPDRADFRRDRGMVKLQADAFGPAVADLEEYLRRAPDAQDAANVREHLRLARKLLVHTN